MANDADFSWVEVGARIRDRRIRAQMSQQALAAVAGITQNGVFRLEAGETNPQLSTLRQIATALGCTVRDLVVGISDVQPVFADRYRRLRRIVESGDEAALRVLDSGIDAAEALLERSGSLPALPPRKLIIGSQGWHSSGVRFSRPHPSKTRSEVDQEVVGKAFRKASAPFGNSRTKDETKSKNSQL